MILRERVGGDGRILGLPVESCICLEFLLLANADRLEDWLLNDSGEHVTLLERSSLGEWAPCSAADCKAGGGRAKLDSSDEAYFSSRAVMSVEGPGVGGNAVVGMMSGIW